MAVWGVGLIGWARGVGLIGRLFGARGGEK
jgi:hypothetical protein